VRVEGSPGFGRVLQANNVCKHVGRECVENPSEHLLITRNPGRVLRILNDDLLVVGVLRLQGLLRRLLFPFNEIKDTSAAKGRDDKCLPDQRVVAREQLQGWRPECCSKNRSG
jgi:hypothetical protein